MGLNLYNISLPTTIYSEQTGGAVMVKIEVQLTGTFNGTWEATDCLVNFKTALPGNPIAAWIGDFTPDSIGIATGAIWTIVDLNLNNCLVLGEPQPYDYCGQVNVDGTPITFNLILLLEN